MKLTPNKTRLATQKDIVEVATIPPKEMLIKFIREAKPYENFSFQIYGNEKDAESYVQNMRVALSRFRGKIKVKGQVPRYFKVMLKSISCNVEMQSCLVILQQTDGSQDVEVSKEINSILKDLSI